MFIWQSTDAYVCISFNRWHGYCLSIVNKTFRLTKSKIVFNFIIVTSNGNTGKLNKARTICFVA